MQKNLLLFIQIFTNRILTLKWKRCLNQTLMTSIINIISKMLLHVSLFPSQTPHKWLNFPLRPTPSHPTTYKKVKKSKKFNITVSKIISHLHLTQEVSFASFNSIHGSIDVILYDSKMFNRVSKKFAIIWPIIKSYKSFKNDNSKNFLSRITFVVGWDEGDDDKWKTSKHLFHQFEFPEWGKLFKKKKYFFS